MGQSNFNQLCYLIRYRLRARVSPSRPHPLLCGFKLTHKCNLKCFHCPFWRKPGQDISFNEAEKILHKLHSEGIRILIFEGGEPLLWKGIFPLTETAKSMFFSVGITTNGTIDLSTANPDIYFVSIDGTKEVHDRIRGKSFDRIMDNIERHRDKKIIANITISSLNQDHITRLVKYLEGKIKGVTIQFFYPFPGIEELSVGMQKRKEVLDNLIYLKKQGYSLLDSHHCLKKMKDNSWKCHDFLIASVDPDGYIHHGCYLKNRLEDISCAKCGYAAHCEISAAYRLNPGAIRTAAKIFW
ncbi:MAG: radical SAM protein [Actinomycetota bacterium]